MPVPLTFESTSPNLLTGVHDNLNQIKRALYESPFHCEGNERNSQPFADVPATNVTKSIYLP